MKKFYLVVVASFIITSLPNFSFGQQFFRIKADFSIKEKHIDGTQSLTMGTVYYDKFHDKIIYDVKFPEKQIIVVLDTLTAIIENNKLQNKHQTTANTRFSIFRLSLNGNLENFGLDNSSYKVSETVKENDMIITTWSPPKQLQESFGKVIVSQKKRSIYGVAFYNVKETLVGKQFFKNYTNFNGFKFPTELVQVIYNDGKEYYKLTTFKNVIVDDLANDKIYNFIIPR
jgi:hypothetical protein